MFELVPDGDLIDVMGIWASVHATDAAAFDQRLNALAATVCDADPRTKSNAAPMPPERSLGARHSWPASADQTTARPQQSGTRLVRR